MGVVKLGSENQRKLKSSSRAIEIIAKIMRIFVYVGIGALIIVMFVIPSQTVNGNSLPIIVNNTVPVASCGMLTIIL